MFGIDILDVAIGLFFAYLVLSLAVTTANEMSAAWFRRRAWMLHRGISTLLDDAQLADKLYDHVPNRARINLTGGGFFADARKKGPVLVASRYGRRAASSSRIRILRPTPYERCRRRGGLGRVGITWMREIESGYFD